ncbi:MAG: type II secretion system protein GspG [Planctomycetota bacterium]
MKRPRALTTLLPLVLLAACGEGGGPADGPARAALVRDRIETARNHMVSLHGAVVLFYVNHTRYPERLEELLEPEAGLGCWDEETLPVDPWGERYVYRLSVVGAGACTILSKGPDRREGTPDDIVDRRGMYVTGK